MLFSWISLLPWKLILENLIIVYKCNDSLVNPRNLIRELFWGRSTSKIVALEIFPLCGNLVAIWYKWICKQLAGNQCKYVSENVGWPTVIVNPALGWILLALTNVSDLYLYLAQHKFNTFILYIITILYKHLINIAFRSIITKFISLTTVSTIIHLYTLLLIWYAIYTKIIYLFIQNVKKI